MMLVMQWRKMSNCKKVLENIYLLAEDLKNSVENNENQ